MEGRKLRNVGWCRVGGLLCSVESVTTSMAMAGSGCVSGCVRADTKVKVHQFLLRPVLPGSCVRLNFDPFFLTPSVITTVVLL